MADNHADTPFLGRLMLLNPRLHRKQRPGQGALGRGGDDEWLVLEKAEGERLADLRGPGHYLTAARALASFHTRAAGWLADSAPPSRALQNAVEDLTVTLPGLASSALTATRRRTADGTSAGADLSLLGQVEELTHHRLPDLIPDVQRFPIALIHGDCHSGNLFLTGDGRLSLIDWSSAGLGPGLLDLAALLDVAERTGDPSDPPGEVRRAYFEALPPIWRAAYGDPERAWDLMGVVRALLELRWFAATGEDFAERVHRELRIVERNLSRL
ncbi:MAG: phosphotransferase [Bacillota bacterium]